MNRTFIVNESQYAFIALLIKEGVEYDDEDYIEVFLNFFKNWVQSKNYQNLPLSFLLKKHLDDFCRDLNIEYDTENNSWRGNISHMKNVGRMIVNQGLAKISSLRPEVKFTEKFAKPLKYFIEELDLPPYISLKFEEDKPYEVRVGLEIDWNEMIKNPPTRKSPSSVTSKLKSKIENFLGLTMGRPEHGELDLNMVRNPKLVGFEDWKKNVLDKVIKKRIKSEVKESRKIHRLVFKVDEYNLGSEIVVYFRDYPYPSWDEKTKVKEGIREILTDMGYNVDTLKVKIA